MAIPNERHRGKEVLPDVLRGGFDVDIPLFGRKRDDLPYSVAEYQSRLENVRSSMKSSSIDVLLVRKPEDIRYLTGFYTIGDSENQTLLISQDREPTIVCRLLEAILVEQGTWLAEWYSNHDSRSGLTTLKTVLEKLFSIKGKSVAIDFSAISLSDFRALERSLEQPLVDAGELVEKIRLVRTPKELEVIRKVSAISEAGTQAGIKAIKMGALESEIYLASFNELIRQGSTEPGYTPIIRTNNPAGHGTWEVGKKVERGLVFLEMSGNLHGHHAPLMRTCFVLKDDNDEVPAWVLEAESIIQKIFETILPMMKPGVKASVVDKVAREIAVGNTFGATMVSRAGYTAGGTATVPTGYAGWGDACFSFAGNNHRELQENQTFHFIPWLQKIDGDITGPIGLSDTLVITKDGGQRLGKLPLEITILRPDGTVVPR